MRISQSGEKVEHRFSGLYQGGAFTGKTHAMCSWPKVALITFDPDDQTAEKMEDVTIVRVDSWGEFASDILPHVMNRSMDELCKKPIETIAIDTISIASSKLREEMRGRGGEMRVQDWGTFKDKLTEAAYLLTESTKPTDTHAGYHILFATHLKEVTGDDGIVLAWRPAIDGQFRELLPRLVSFCFLCEATTETIREAGQPGEQRAVYKVRTVPPNKLYICGDRVGGGTRKVLPPTTSGLYHDLMAAWGIQA